MWFDYITTDVNFKHVSFEHLHVLYVIIPFDPVFIYLLTSIVYGPNIAQKVLIIHL